MKKICLCFALAANIALAASGQSGQPMASAPLRLEDVVRLALERSPELKASESAIHAAEHRIAPAKTLPDPTVSAGWAGKLTPLATMPGDASSYRGVTVSEQLPYPGKLRLQGELAARDVALAHTDCEAARRKITTDATLAYAEYFYLDKALDATRQNKELLEKLAAIAEAKYRVGKAMQQDVLRAQLEISMLLEKLAMLEEQRAEAEATLNALLQQPPETELPRPEELQAQPLHYSLDALYAMANTKDSDVLRQQAMIERGKTSLALSLRQSRPDISVSYMFEQRTNQPDMNGVTVSVSLPVFWKQRQHEAVAEAAATLHSAEEMQQGQQNSVRAEVRRQYLAAETAQRLLTLYTQGIVPQSSLALESAMSEYQVGKVDFFSLIASFSSVLNYETDSYRKLADYNIAVARIESMTGESVTSAPTAEVQKLPAVDLQGAR
ncbi:TolC family protein [Telmatobacter bradus]|uniref:TolC family protein n=1 Tax=Telmatobacter bradus TaxID=474953 RepID=UPI003B4291D5